MESEPARSDRLAKEAIEAINAGDNITARQRLEECMAIRKSLGDDIGIAKTLTNLGIVDLQEGDEIGAKEKWEQSLVMHRTRNNPQGMLRSLCNLIGVAYRQGDYTVMRTLEEQSVALVREGDDRQYLARSLDSLALATIYEHDYDYARTVQRESLAIKRELGLDKQMPFTLNLCADIAMATRDFERGAIFYRAYQKQCALLELPQREKESQQIVAKLADLQSMLGEAAYQSAYSIGEGMTLEQCIAAAAEFCKASNGNA